MAVDSLESPSWLKDCMQIRFYEERCEKHTRKYKTIYCRSCNGTLECEICWKDSTKHHGHEFLQVYIASWRTSVEIGDINRVWDASNIQVYKINYKQVVYLNPNQKGREEKNEQTPKCQSCRRKLMGSEYRFCSIACKMRGIGFSYNVRRRKARFPQRAPLSSIDY
ncbi:protein RGF1 INDUCIBLE TRANSCRIPTION FACTOR 1-like [Primulina tabacum]|uniref:protein RGF1 INDUCIBLE TRANSCRIPTION FACTOR 1-like n=1 Tax=Primulina tabacum TaxID=48773 RepID=UPI003F5946CF